MGDTWVMHLPFAARKAIALQYAAFSSFQPRDEILTGLQGADRDFVAGFDLRVKDRAAKCYLGKLGKESFTMSAFLLETQREWQSGLLGVEARSNAGRDAVRSFREALTRIDCNTCVQETGRGECSGREQDNSNVSDRGLCLEPIKHLFDRARKGALEYYGKLDAAKRVEVILTTRHEEGKLHTYGLASGVKATTELRSTLLSVVEATFDPLEFSWETYLALRCILFHELVCHVFQGCVESRGPRARLGDCPFTEGWMDHVATLISCRDLDREVVAYSRQFLEVESKFRSARLEALGDRIRLGERAAERLVAAYGTTTLYSDAVSRTIDFSVRLNARPVDSSILARIANDVLSIVPANPHLSDARSRCEQLTAIADRFRRDGDVAALGNSIKKLSASLDERPISRLIYDWRLV